jgi:uncharacterized protein
MMKTGTASGLQIAFFTFAVLLLAVPVTDWLSGGLPGESEERLLLAKALPFFIAAAILFGFPKLRRRCREYLARPIPAGDRFEVVMVTLAKLLFPFALIGAFALWHWTNGGEQGLGNYVRAWRSHEGEMARAFLPAHLILTFLGAGLLAPVFEELVFRGLLYRAWERRFGWFAAMLLVSVVFGLYHRHFWSAFASSIVLVCLYRRTGSLWAPIIVHALGNISLWYPLLGRHVLPRDPGAASDISQWGLHLTLLAMLAIALPWYVWMSRRERRDAGASVVAATSVHGALPQ